MENLIKTTNELIKGMMKNGFGEPQDLLVLANSLISEFNITKEQALFVIEECVNNL